MPLAKHFNSGMENGNQYHCPRAGLCFLPAVLLYREGSPTLPPALKLLSPTSSDCSAVPSSNQQLQQLQPLQPQQQQVLHEAQTPGTPLSAAGTAVVAGVTVSRRHIPPSATTAYMTQSIMPQHANTLGITFGGQVSEPCM
eukprot:GHRR01029167.1.p1 GENE.GHRR01029167.1~~GHRR01029167.1.p1  ORF type:complete len:141 (-),score=52.76 GHRR01029167.1:303-725(-)